MNKREEERKIIREVIEYADDESLEHNADYEEIEKIRGWIIRIVEIEAQEMGYKPRVIYGEINRPRLLAREDNGELFLRFSRSNVNESTAFFAVEISNNFSTPRALEMYFNENYHEDVLEKMKDSPIDPYILIFDDVFHELRHMRQYLMARTGVSSYLSLMYAKEKFITSRNYKFYSKNHNSMRTEEDAMMEAVRNWKEVSGEERRITRSYSFFYKVGIMKKEIQRDDYIFDMFDKLMKKEENRYILKVFPVLQKEYNENGTRKSLNELLRNMKLEIEEFLNTDGLSDSEKDILIKDCKGMYFEIIYREMKKKATIQEVTSLAETYDKDDKTALFSEMKLYFEERYKSEKRDIEETGFITSTKEQEQEIKLREEYYQAKIDFLNVLVEQQQNENLLNGIINKGKKFVRTR